MAGELRGFRPPPASAAEHLLARSRPLEPEFRAAQRGRVLLDFEESGERVHAADHGWVRIDGPWVHLFGDEQGYWQSWPMHNVVCIDWDPVEPAA